MFKYLAGRMALDYGNGQHFFRVWIFDTSRRFSFSGFTATELTFGLKQKLTEHDNTKLRISLGKSLVLLAARAAPLVLVVAAGAGALRHPHTPAMDGTDPA
jgi:hypothetical protein